MDLFSSWWQLSLLLSVILAFYSGMNGRHKLDGVALVFWRSLGAAALLLPVLPFVTWPQSLAFYGGSLLLGALYGLGDIFMFDAFARHGGAAVSRLVPLSNIGRFLLWSTLFPASLLPLLSPPWKLAGVAACLGLTLLATYLMRRCAISRDILKTLTPTLLTFTVAGVLAKFLLDATPGWHTVLVMTWFISLGMCATMLIYSFFFRPGVIRTHRKPGPMLLGAVLFLGVALCFQGAIGLAENPGYPGVVAMLSSVWLFVYHKARGLPDRANLPAGILTITAAAGLILIVG